MAELHGGKMVVRALHEEGVSHIFGICGGHIAPIYDAMIDSDLKLIGSRHEQAAHCPEIAGLEHWLKEIDRKRPLTKREQLERDLTNAVQDEDYERAARVRDALRKLKPKD